MNRTVVSDNAWTALAECDLLARCLNEHSVAVLREALHAIRAEVTRPTRRHGTGVRSATTIGREEPGSLATNPSPSEDTAALPEASL